MATRPSRTLLLAFILPLLLVLLRITVFSNDPSPSVWAAPQQRSKLNPTKPLSTGEKRDVKNGLKQASLGQIESSHTGNPKTAVQNLVGRGGQSGFRLDNQGVKNGLTHAAVQRNGPKKPVRMKTALLPVPWNPTLPHSQKSPLNPINHKPILNCFYFSRPATHLPTPLHTPPTQGDRTTVAQAAVPANSHPSRVQKALIKSANTGRVEPVKPHDRAQVQRGLDWKQNSGKADRPAGTTKKGKK
ncbi:hypothetical protein DFJ73DRAFT_768331 [Zopfochytrium polystomum]|nr:hypothetical protein DFJ73DRAFT_768331 [Zopfochytrium polystomum]